MNIIHNEEPHTENKNKNNQKLKCAFPKKLMDEDCRKSIKRRTDMDCKNFATYHNHTKFVHEPYVFMELLTITLQITYTKYSMKSGKKCRSKKNKCSNLDGKIRSHFKQNAVIFEM